MGTHPIFESDFDCLTDSKKSFFMDVRVVGMSASSSERQLPKKSFFRKVMDDMKADEKANWKALLNSFIMLSGSPSSHLSSWYSGLRPQNWNTNKKKVTTFC